MRVLLTGGTGFIGSHCVDPLLERGYEVVAVSRQPAAAPRSETRVADLLDPAQVEELVRVVRPTHLLHLAWDVTPGAYWTARNNWDWVNASLHLLTAFARHGGQRAVFVGTCAEYAPSLEACMEDRTPIRPETLYGACKAALGMLLPVWAAQHGLRSTAWARLFYIYGPREHPARLVPTVIRSLLAGERMGCASGEQVRDFLYVQDAADALAALLDSAATGAVNVGSGTASSMRSFLSRIGAQLGRERLLEFGARPPDRDAPPTLVANIERLTHEIGWAPSTSVEQGVTRTIEWWRGRAADAA